MTRASIIAFVLGCVATTALYEATGMRVLAGPGAPSTAAARLQPPPASPLARGRPGGSHAGSASDVARLGAEVADLRNRAAFAEGQVEAALGHEIPWPRDVAPEYRRESVEQQLQEFVVDRGLAKIKDIDCSEYPCVEVLQLPETGPQAIQKLHDALNDMIKRYYSGPVALSISASQAGEGPDAVSLASVSVMPNDEDLKTRTRHRSNLGLQNDSP
jgi:sulfite reductase alpha subunit-like flavoprotein